MYRVKITVKVGVESLLVAFIFIIPLITDARQLILRFSTEIYRAELQASNDQPNQWDSG